MKKLGSILVLLGALIETGAAADAPVAMRVEVQPLKVVGEAATVRVVIQVSPEDRARIGRNAIVRIKLDGEVPRGQSPMWAVRIEDDGSAEVETVWTQGEHELQVEIEGPSGQEKGLWVGRIGVKGDVQETAPKPTPSPTPIEPAPISEPTPIPGPAPESAAEPKDAETSVTEMTIVGAAAASTGTTLAELPQGAPEKAPPSRPEPQLPVEEAPLEELKPVSVEPLRGTPVEPPAAGAGAIAGPDPEPIEELRSEVSPEVAAVYEGWAAGSGDAMEFTAIITRDREPAENLVPGDLALKVGGAGVAIDRLGDRERAPLLLGLVVDLSPESIGRWSAVGRRLEPLLARAGGDRGEIFVAVAGQEGVREADPDRVSEAFSSAANGDLAARVAASLGDFAGRRGRSFLLVVTDGQSEPSKAAWREAVATADVSGVPVLVIALWDSDFRQSVRKQLQEITSVSGGRLFLAQGTDQLDSVTERYGIALDAGVAVRFKPPAGMRVPAAIDLKAADRSLDVTTPSKLR